MTISDPSQDPDDGLVTFNLVSAGYDEATVWTDDVTLVATKNGYESALWTSVDGHYARTGVSLPLEGLGGFARGKGAMLAVVMDSGLMIQVTFKGTRVKVQTTFCGDSEPTLSKSARRYQVCGAVNDQYFTVCGARCFLCDGVHKEGMCHLIAFGLDGRKQSRNRNLDFWSFRVGSLPAISAWKVKLPWL